MSISRGTVSPRAILAAMSPMIGPNLNPCPLHALTTTTFLYFCLSKYNKNAFNYNNKKYKNVDIVGDDRGQNDHLQ